MAAQQSVTTTPGTVAVSSSSASTTPPQVAVVVTSSISSQTSLPAVNGNGQSPSPGLEGVPTASPTIDGASEPAPANTNLQVLAGVAVGCAIAGLLIGGLIAFLLLKRRQGRRDQAKTFAIRPASTGPDIAGKSLVYPTANIPLSPINKALPTVAALAFLPPPATDQEVRTRITAVIRQIHEYVDSTYQDRNIPLDNRLEEAIEDYETSRLGTPLVTLFKQSAHSTVLIKHCLTYHILNLTLSPSQGVTPFLPAEYAAPVTETYHKLAGNKLSHDDLTAFSLWKQLTAYLTLPRNRQHHHQPSEPPSYNSNPQLAKQDHHAFAAKFTQTFRPYLAITATANTHTSNNYDANTDGRMIREIEQLTTRLARVIGFASDTAAWVFGQAGHYWVDWAVRSGPGAGVENGNSSVNGGEGFRSSVRGTRGVQRGVEQVVLGPEVRRVGGSGEGSVIVPAVVGWV